MWRRALTAAVLVYSAWHLVATGLRQPLGNFSGDFLASFPSWKVSLLLDRLDWYAGSLAQRWGPPQIWHYGPLLHLITVPLFAFASLRQAYLVWLFVNYAFLCATAWLAIRVVDAGRATWNTALVVIVVFCNFGPLYEALTQRTIEVLELLLLFGAFALHQRRRDGACGAAVGAAVMAKFLPLIYLPWFVLRRNWRALGAAVAVIVPVAIATQLVLGWQHSGILIQLREGSFLPSALNQSLSGAISLVLQWTHSRLPLPIVSRLAIGAALVALSALMLRRRTDADDLEFGLLTAAMVLLPPHNENYYLAFLILPYLLLYARYRAMPWSWRPAVVALSFLIVAAPIPFSLMERVTGVRQLFPLYLQARIPFVGAILLVVVLVAELQASPNARFARGFARQAKTRAGGEG